MNGNPRNAAFKKKVAIEALRGEKSVNEIAKEYGVHPGQVTQWKKALIDGAEAVFSKGIRKGSDQEIEKAALESKIGQLTI